MKNVLIAFSIIFILSSCSSVELEAVSSSEEETQRILAMGLSHEENLIEASKLDTPHIISVVSLQLTNARDKKIQDEIDLVASEELASMVIVSSGGSKFIGSKVSKLKKTGVLETDVDIQNFNLEGTKNLNNGIIEHKLVLSISHNSKNARKYDSANLCDEWNRCDTNKQEVNVISSAANNCTTSTCNFEEVMELNLSDDFLRSASDTGFTIRFNAKRKGNKINVSKAYLMGYLKVAQ